jgi:hypothetical protein
LRLTCLRKQANNLQAWLVSKADIDPMHAFYSRPARCRIGSNLSGTIGPVGDGGEVIVSGGNARFTDDEKLDTRTELARNLLLVLLY